MTIEYTFNLVTPILSGVFGSGIDLGTEANAVVFSDALSFGDPLPEESTDPDRPWARRANAWCRTSSA